jgi:hypothetical protein
MSRSVRRARRCSKLLGQHQVSAPLLILSVSRVVIDVSALAPNAYTTEELAKCSAWCLTKFSGTRQVFVGLHDRAMLLFGASTALRGEGTRMLQLSDLFLSEVCIDDIQLGYTVPVSIVQCRCRH